VGTEKHKHVLESIKNAEEEVNAFNDKVNEWYKYLYSGIVYNVWGLDTAIAADSDFDGDIVFSTDNKIIVENSYGGNPITYEKHPTEKKIIKEKNLYKADLKSFDSKIGYITNCSTTLYCMLSQYSKDSKEYKAIYDRLRDCRVLQGNQIDKAKGLIVKPFPKHWTNWINPNKENTSFSKEEIEFNNNILIEKRPMFMKYLYPNYKHKADKYYNTYNSLCLKKYNKTYRVCDA
jgi:hypothetical protein